MILNIRSKSAIHSMIQCWYQIHASRTNFFRRLSFTGLAWSVSLCGQIIPQNQLMKQVSGTCSIHPEVFVVENEGIWLVLCLLADPHLLEGGRWGQVGATDAHQIPSGEWWSWSLWCWVPRLWSPSAFHLWCLGTWWCQQTALCWHKCACGCAYYFMMELRSQQCGRIPYPGKRAGKEVRDTGAACCWCWLPGCLPAHSSSAGRRRMQQGLSPAWS